ncbi:MAG: hypothetical protein ACE5WD_09350 [Candidatus Aminicenantia bacterium]
MKFKRESYIKFFISLGIIGIFLISGYGELENPSIWIKYPGNPVIPEGALSDWDRWKSDPFVMKDGDIYKMWYGTNQDGTKTQIGYAESYDGINWAHHPTPVVRIGSDGAWDDEDIETPTVVKYNGIYHLWYCARGEPEGSEWSPEATYKIGHATSSDGIHWKKDPNNPVVPLGEMYIDWDWACTAEPTVIVEDGTFKIWYLGGDVYNGKFRLRVGYATSNDGSNWTKYQGNPVLSSPEKNRELATPSVLRSEKGYTLWCSLMDEEHDFFPNGPFRYATSSDGINWTMHPEYVLECEPSVTWDHSGIFGPTVLFDEDENKYKMWYSGYETDWATYVHFGIGYATKEVKKKHSKGRR